MIIYILLLIVIFEQLEQLHLQSIDFKRLQPLLKWIAQLLLKQV